MTNELVLRLPAAVYTCDADGRVTLFNDAAAALWGQRPELGKDMWCGSYRIFYPDGSPMPLDECPMAVALRERRPVPGHEIVIERPDGQRRNVLPHPEPLFDECGELTGAVNMLVDVTELKRAEVRDRLLLQIDDRTRELSDPGRIMQAAARLLGEQLRASRCVYCVVEGGETLSLAGDYTNGVASIDGRYALSGLGDQWLELMNAGLPFVVEDTERDGRIAGSAAMYRELEIRSVICVPLHKAGRFVAAMAVHNAAPRPWREDEVDLVRAVAERCWESIERARVSSILRESEERYRAIVECQTEMVCRFRPEGTILLANGAYARARGCRPESLVGADFWAFIPESEHAPVRELLESLSPERPEVRIENEFQTESGPRWTLWTNRALSFDERGRAAEVQSSGIDITERKRIEMALRESENRFRVLSDAAPVLIWMSGPDAGCTWFNRQWLEFVGREMEHELGRGWAEHIHPDDVERRLGAYSAAFDAREPFSVEYRLRRHDGEYRWLFTRGVPMYGADGTFTGYIGTCLDVTERRAAEQALTERERYLHAVIETTPECVKIVGPGGEVRYMNPAGVRIFGAESAEDVVGRSIYDLIAPEHRDRYRDMHERVCGGEKVSIEFDIVGLRGTRRHMHTNAVPLPEGGELAHLAITRDVTMQKRAEAALRDSEGRFRTMADNISQFAWMADETGAIFWYNKRWYEYTGTTFEEMSGWGWRKVHHPEHVRAVAEKFKTHIEAGEAWEDTFPLRAKDGTYRWFLSRAQPIRDASGRIVRWFGTNTDVTEQRAAEEALARHKAELERQVEERTRELRESHTRLRVSERLASLGTLSAGLGHDIGNLLMPVRVRIESLKAAGLPADLQSHIDEIKTSADYLQQLANGLRLMAADPERVSPAQSTELQSWWADAQQVMKTALPRGVALEADFEPGCRVAMAKPALSQTVFNLVQNAGDAIKSSGLGSVVRVRGRREDDAAVVTVEDDGPGMTGEVRDRCLEPFFTTKTREISTGLGLVLVGGLIRDAGGSVELRTAPGAGTRFTLRLPLSPEGGASDSVRRRAVVSLSDGRLRAFVAAELKSNAFDVVEEAEAADGVDVAVVQEMGGDLAEKARHVILFGHNGIEHNGGEARHAGLSALGPRPRPAAIRDAVRAAAREAPGP